MRGNPQREQEEKGEEVSIRKAAAVCRIYPSRRRRFFCFFPQRQYFGGCHGDTGVTQPHGKQGDATRFTAREQTPPVPLFLLMIVNDAHLFAD